MGPSYSPQGERAFRDIDSNVLKASVKGRELPNSVGFSDSAFAGCSLTFKSTSSSGSVLFFKGSPILWASCRQSISATSTCEAELCGLYDTVQLLQGMGYLSWFDENHKEILLFGDNQSNYIIVAKSKAPARKTKHIQLRYAVLKEHSDSITYVPIALNMADPLTKPMGRPFMFYETSPPYLPG